MQKERLSWLVKAADAQWVVRPEGDPEITWIAAKLSHIRPGCLYIELEPGTASRAVEMGAGAVIAPSLPVSPGYPCARCEGDPYEAFCRIAAWYRRQFHTRLIAVAGGDGKTTVREMLYRILSQGQKASRSRWELTGDLGIPETLLGLDDGDRFAVVEMACTTKGSFKRLSKICRPSAAVITGVGSAHIGSFGSRAEILKERLSITDAMEPGDPVILCADDPLLYDLNQYVSGDILYYGIDTPCDVTGRIVSADRDGTVLDIMSYGRTTRVNLRLPGRGSCYDALAAFAAAELMGAPVEDIRYVLEAFRPLPGRLQLLRVSNGALIINDCWTSSPESVAEAADYFAQFDGQRKIVVLGEMEDLGKLSADAHFEAGRRMAAAGADLLLATGAHAEDIARGGALFPRTRVQTFPDARSIANYLRTDRRPGDVALFKAGRASRFERIIDYVYHDKELTPAAGEPEWRRKKTKPGRLQDVRDSRKEEQG